MELDAKPTEENIVLVHDKILMALLGANGIKPIHIFRTGWPGEPADESETYLAYKPTMDFAQFQKGYEDGTVIVNLSEYLTSAAELEWRIGKIEYVPKGNENE